MRLTILSVCLTVGTLANPVPTPAARLTGSPHDAIATPQALRPRQDGSSSTTAAPDTASATASNCQLIPLPVHTVTSNVGSIVITMTPTGFMTCSCDGKLSIDYTSSKGDDGALSYVSCKDTIHRRAGTTTGIVGREADLYPFEIASIVRLRQHTPRLAFKQSVRRTVLLEIPRMRL